VESSELVRAWRAALNNPDKSWVLFEHGTCVVLMKPEADLAEQATFLLREFGPVHGGSSFGDFGTIKLEDGRGWVVTSHHNDILTFVGPSEVVLREIDPDDEAVAVGLLGRSKRGRDAEQLRVLYVEDNRRNLQS
jgi:hypothetical protein